MSLINLAGQRFGMLVAVEHKPEPGRRWRRSAVWICRCDCGGETAVLGLYLRGGTTRSCGCSSGRILTRTNEEKRTLRTFIRDHLGEIEDRALRTNAEAILKNHRTTLTGTRVERLREVAAQIKVLISKPEQPQ